MKNFKQNPSTCGFTLIELMIVVAIIGILAAIAIPKFANLVKRSKDASTVGMLGSIRSALSLYYASTEGTFPQYADGTDISDSIQNDISTFLNTERVEIEYSDDACPNAGGVLTDDLSDGPTGTIYTMNYDGNSSRPTTWGRFLLNCTETDSKGIVWSSY